MDATAEGTLETLLQQGCSPIPRWQSPAIFLQHAISDGVICVVGRQASAGIAVHTMSKPNTTMEWHLAMVKCYPHLPAAASG
jgi:hypothetical protein